MVVLAVAGCSGREPKITDAVPDLTNTPATEAVITAADNDTIRFVAADEWGELAASTPSTSNGWIAMPPPQKGELYQSPQDPTAQGLLKPDACLECHAEIVESFAATAHARTAQYPSRDSILGALDAPDNRLATNIDDFFSKWWNATVGSGRTSSFQKTRKNQL